MKYFFLTCFLLCVGIHLPAQADSAWTRLPMLGYGSIVKVIGESQGSFWVWSFDSKSKKHFLHQFDTTSCHYINSTFMDTAHVKVDKYATEIYLLDIYALHSGLVAVTGPAGRDHTAYQIFRLTRQGRFVNGSALVPELVEVDQKLASLDFIVDNSGNSLIALYNVVNLSRRSKAASGMRIARFNAKATRTGMQLLEIPASVLSDYTYGPLELRKGLEGEFYVLGKHIEIFKLKTQYYVLRIDSLLKTKYEFVLDWNKGEPACMDIYFDHQKNICLTGLFEDSTHSRFMFIAVLDQSGKMVRFTEKEVSVDCFLFGHIFSYGRSGSFNTQGNWAFTISDYVTRGTGGSIIVLDFGCGISSFSIPSDGATSSLHTGRAIVQVNPDHTIQSFGLLHEIFDGHSPPQAKTNNNPKYATANFGMTGIYSFGKNGDFARFIVANLGTFTLHNGEQLKLFYNSGLKNHAVGCMSDHLSFDKDVLQTYSLNFAGISEMSRHLEYPDADGILFMSQNYIFRVNANKVLVVKQKEGQQFIGTVSL